MRFLIVLAIFLTAGAAFSKNKDIIFVLDENAAFGNGHIAVMIGSEDDGWHYFSINGTGKTSKPWGKNLNADTGTVITGRDGRRIKSLRRAVRRICDINPKEKHRYNKFRRVFTSKTEDSVITREVKKIALSKVYGIIGPGNSCIDVAQTAFSALVKHRRLDRRGASPGKTDLIPNRWFRKMDFRIKTANSRSKNKNKIENTLITSID